MSLQYVCSLYLCYCCSTSKSWKEPATVERSLQYHCILVSFPRLRTLLICSLRICWHPHSSSKPLADISLFSFRKHQWGSYECSKPFVRTAFQRRTRRGGSLWAMNLRWILRCFSSFEFQLKLYSHRLKIQFHLNQIKGFDFVTALDRRGIHNSSEME